MRKLTVEVTFSRNSMMIHFPGGDVKLYVSGVHAGKIKELKERYAFPKARTAKGAAK